MTFQVFKKKHTRKGLLEISARQDKGIGLLGNVYQAYQAIFDHPGAIKISHVVT